MDSHGMRVGALALAVLALQACASSREDAAWSDLASLEATFRPLDADVAPLGSDATLGRFVEIALERNPALRGQAFRWRADLERARQARYLPDPQLKYGGFLEEVETRVGPQRHRFGVSQRIPWPGKLTHASAVAFETAEGTRARTEATRLRLIYQVSKAYAAYYYLARERTITRQTLSLVRRWEAVAQARLRAGGRAAHQHVIKAQVEIGRLEDRLASLNHARRPRAAALRALLNLPPGFVLPWPTSLPAIALKRSDPDLLAILARKSPLLARLQRAISARERAIDLAQQSYLPDFVLGLEYIEVGPAVRNAAGVRARGSGDDAVVATFGVSLPIWFGRYRSRVAEARARLRAAELDRVEAENALTESTTRALFDHRDAERKLRLYRDTLVPKAEQSLKATATAYETGAGGSGFLDLLDAERILLEFHLARERALADRLTSLAELAMLTGAELLPWANTTSKKTGAR